MKFIFRKKKMIYNRETILINCIENNIKFKQVLDYYLIEFQELHQIFGGNAKDWIINDFAIGNDPENVNKKPYCKLWANAISIFGQIDRIVMGQVINI